MNLASVRESTHLLTVQLERSRARWGAGLESRLELNNLFRATPGVATIDSVGRIQEALSGADGRRAMRLQSLLRHVRGLITESRTARLQEELAQRSIERVPGSHPGAEWTLRLSLSRLAADPDRNRRSLVERHASAGAAALNASWASLWEQHQEDAQEAGFPSAAHAWADRMDLDLAALESDATAFLSATEAMYGDVSEWWLQRATAQRPFPYGAERHDLLHALALPGYAGLFPKGDARLILRYFESAGLSTSAEGRIKLDGELRDRKQPAPFVWTADSEGDVVAFYRAEGGLGATRDLLRVWGEAQQAAYVVEERPFEDRMLGDPAVAGAFGGLFQNVLLDRKWVKNALDAETPDFHRLLALVELFRLRHAAAVFLHSLQINREGISESISEQYAERLSRTLGAQWPAGLCLWECRPTFAAGADLRSAAFEAVLFPNIREQFNEDWWLNPRAGVFLKQIFAQGRFESSRVLATSLSLGEPRLMSGVARLRELLA